MLFRRRLLVLLTVFLALPSLVGAADVPVRLNLYAEGGVLTKKVTSLKARRMRQMIHQTKDFSCGAAAVATLLRYHYGKKITEMDAILGMFKHGDQGSIKKRGFSLLDMKRYTQTFGYQANGYKVPKLELLKNLTSPAITIVETNKYKHFVVIRRVDKKYVYLADPAWGNRKVSWKEFDKIWPEQIIFLVQGPTEGTPEGLFAEPDLETSKVALVLRKETLVGHRFAMDPSESVAFFTGIPLVNIMQFIPGGGP